MRHIFILLFLTNRLLGQSLTENEIVNYVNKIDSLKNENILTKYSFPDMSHCGGALEGYNYGGKLVFIDATFGAELGFSRERVYIKDTVIYKIINHEHLPEWQKYHKNYPIGSNEWNPSKMTYTDTVITIQFSDPIYFEKSSNGKIISNDIDWKLLEGHLECIRRMRLELGSMKNGY